MTRLRGRGRRLLPAVLAPTLLSLLAAAPAEAHGLVGKQDLPIPKWLFGWAAAVVLVISFVGLATLWQSARFAEVRERAVVAVPGGLLDPVCGLLGVLLFTGLVYAGFAGTQQTDGNIVPTVVYVPFWVGIPIASLLLGDVFRAFNPWRAVGRAAGFLVARVGGEPPEPLSYPKRLGRWPAALGILLFAALELADANRDDPSHLSLLMLLYAAVQLLGMSLYGVRAWEERGDAFGVYFGLFATLSPLRWTRTRLLGRAPLAGTAQIAPSAGLVGLVCVMIGTTSFDGFSASSFWTDIATNLQPRLVDAGLSMEHATELVFLGGILVMVGVVSGLYLLGCAGMRSALPQARTEGTLDLARRFAPTLVPIALAYVVAHYFGLLSYNGQGVPALLSDPLGRGHDYLGTRDWSIDYGWISATGIWYVQVAALVLGHAAGLALAHDRALIMFPDQPRVAARSQYWMLAVMVAFTSLALWLLSNTA